MTRDLKDIKQKRVISLDEGRDLGSVRRIYLNPEQRRVSGIVVREHGLFGEDKWIDIFNLRCVGEDVLFVRSAKDCIAAEPVGRSLGDMVGMPVATLDGERLGDLRDLEVGRDWTVVELHLSGKRVAPLAGGLLIIGHYSIVVDQQITDAVRQEVDPRPGFFARVFLRRREAPASPAEPPGSRPNEARTTEQRDLNRCV